MTTTLVFIAWLIIALTLVVVGAIRPRRSSHSQFELERREDTGTLRRERLLAGVTALLVLKEAGLLILLTFVSTLLWSVWGLVVALLTFVAALMLRRIRWVRRQATHLYERYEPQLLKVAESVSLFVWLGKDLLEPKKDQKLESTEQLVHLVQSAGQVLSSEQQDLIRRGLRWHTKEVKKVMTSVDDIVFVRRTELLGPLVLDDLHKTGHNRFPVISTNIDNVVGQINIANLLEVDSDKKSPTAALMMAPLDIRLHHDTPLPEALRQLIDHPSQLGLVIDDDSKTVGLVTLSDIMTALLGKNRGGVVQ